MARAKHTHHPSICPVSSSQRALRERWFIAALAVLLLTAAPSALEADSGPTAFQSHGISTPGIMLAAAEQPGLRVNVAGLVSSGAVRVGLGSGVRLPLPRTLGGSEISQLPAARSVRLAAIGGGRAPWLSSTAVALGVLGMASLAAAVIEFLTLRTGRDAQAWTLRVGGPQLILRRRF